MNEKLSTVTGKRFYSLVVLEKHPAHGIGHALWLLQCDCGKRFFAHRSSFDRKDQSKVIRSCGCKRYAKRQHPTVAYDYSGNRHGNLTVIERMPFNAARRKPVWKCLCDCGRETYVTSEHLQNGYRLHCGNSDHPIRALVYPPTPKPYPKEASDIVRQYLPLKSNKKKFVKSDIEDLQMDYLLRAAWILVYKRSQGEDISKYKEKCFIRKYLRCAYKQISKQGKKTRSFEDWMIPSNSI